MNSEPKAANAEARNDLGRRILAALISYQFGLRSIDWALHKYTPGQVDPSWGEIGMQLLSASAQQVSAAMRQATQAEANRRRIHLVKCATTDEDLPF